MREVTINMDEQMYDKMTKSRKSMGMTPDEFAADATEYYLDQYETARTGVTGEEFHRLLDESTERVRRFRKRFKINSQIENPNKRPTLRIVR
jgi:hypothetical protein